MNLPDAPIRATLYAMAIEDRRLGRFVMLASTIMVAGMLVAFFAGCFEPAALSDAEWRERLLAFCDLAEKANEKEDGYLAAVNEANAAIPYRLPDPEDADLKAARDLAVNVQFVLNKNHYPRRVPDSPKAKENTSTVRAMLARLRKAL